MSDEDNGQYEFFSRTRQDQIFAHFKKFHALNPEIWTLYKRFTLEVIARGHKHYSSDAIFHRIRWHVNIDTRTDAPVKLSNYYPAYYSRMFALAYPEHADLFHRRRLVSQNRKAFKNDTEFFETGPVQGEENLMAQLRQMI